MTDSHFENEKGSLPFGTTESKNTLIVEQPTEEEA
jgi:hypothetical protein